MTRRLSTLASLLSLLRLVALIPISAASCCAAAAALPTPREIGRINGETGGMVMFSPDGARILTTNGTNAIVGSRTEAQLWDARTLKPIGEPPRHRGLRLAKFDRAGKKLLTVGWTDDGAPTWRTIAGEAKVWDARTGKLVLGPIRHGGRPLSYAALRPDGSIIATCLNEDPAIRLWDAATGKPRGAWTNRANVVSVQFDKTGSTAVAQSEHGIALWDFESGRLRQELRGLPEGVLSRPPSISADGKRLAVAGSYEAAVYDLVTGEQVATIRPTLRLDEHLSGVGISPDGTRIATSSTATTVEEGAVWDVATGKSRFTVPNAFDGDPAFSPDGTKVVFEVFKSAGLWDVTSRCPFDLSKDFDFSLAAFSPDGKRVVIHSFQGYDAVLEFAPSNR
jgi:WD40 repeat protein